MFFEIQFWLTQICLNSFYRRSEFYFKPFDSKYLEQQPKDYIEILDSVKPDLNSKQLENIHFYSIYNFFFHFNELKGERERKIVYDLLQEYFKILRENNFSIEQSYSRELFSSYILKIGQYYNFQLGFKGTMRVQSAIFTGIVIDLLLLVTGLLKSIFFFPIGTFSMFLYNRYLHYSYGKKKKLYGPRY